MWRGMIAIAGVISTANFGTTWSGVRFSPAKMSSPYRYSSGCSMLMRSEPNSSSKLAWNRVGRNGNAERDVGIEDIPRGARHVTPMDVCQRRINRDSQLGRAPVHVAGRHESFAARIRWSAKPCQAHPPHHHAGMTTVWPRAPRPSLADHVSPPHRRPAPRVAIHEPGSRPARIAVPSLPVGSRFPSGHHLISPSSASR